METKRLPIPIKTAADILDHITVLMGEGRCVDAYLVRRAAPVAVWLSDYLIEFEETGAISEKTLKNAIPILLVALGAYVPTLNIRSIEDDINQTI